MNGRENHSARRHPSPPNGCYCCPPAFQANDCSNILTLRDETPLSLEPASKLNADDVTNPNIITIEQVESFSGIGSGGGGTQDDQLFKLDSIKDITDSIDPTNNGHIGPNENISSSDLGLLNLRLDMIDRQCQEFSKLARDKSIMEENLKNLAYL